LISVEPKSVRIEVSEWENILELME
jgi:hypothetical protein